MIIHRTPAILPMLYPQLLWRKAAGAKKLYLTFDDGPIPELTPWVLDTLAVYGVKATFFCVGDNVSKHPEIYAAIREQGHALGNHTYHHVKGWNMPTSQYLKEVQQCDEVMQPERSAGKVLFRPPYGRIKRRQIARLKTDYEIVMWDVLTADYDQRQQPADCLRKSLAVTRDGSIIVFHDNLKATRNLQFALTPYIEECLARGFTFDLL